MDIGVVLVTYNRLEKLKQALKCYSIQTYMPQYVLVVDNCSTDGTSEYLREWLSFEEPFEKHLVNLKENLGGAGGFYYGMEAACKLKCEWIWLADDDAFPRSDALEKLNDYYDKLTEVEQASIVAVCSAVYNRGEIHYRHRSHVYVSPLKVIIRESDSREYEKEAFEFNMLSYVGSCVRKSVLEKVGLDEKDYFIYFDDSEHSLRMNKEGKFVCVTNSIVDHDSPYFDESLIDWGKYYTKRNDLLMIRKHFPLRYFILRFAKRFLNDASIFSRKDPELKKIYLAAFKDALMNKKGIHDLYKPGWEPQREIKP